MFGEGETPGGTVMEEEPEEEIKEEEIKEEEVEEDELFRELYRLMEEGDRT
jgi:hypothetical protein